MSLQNFSTEMRSRLSLTIQNLPPTVENWPNESSEATFIPFSSVVTCVTWSCRFCQDSVPLTMLGGGAGIFARGSLRGGIVPLLRSLFRAAWLEVLLKTRRDLQPWNIGTRLRPAISSSLHRGHQFFQQPTHRVQNYVIYKEIKYNQNSESRSAISTSVVAVAVNFSLNVF